MYTWEICVGLIITHDGHPLTLLLFASFFLLSPLSCPGTETEAEIVSQVGERDGAYREGFHPFRPFPNYPSL